MSQVTTHVLDAALGRPAADVLVELQDDTGAVIARELTDNNGRVSSLGPDQLKPGTYRLVFATGDYFAASGRSTFYPRVRIDFDVADASAHYHVPVLLSPFAFSTYRGS